MTDGRQRSLGAEEAQYRLLFEASPLPTWISDEATGRFIVVNAAAVARYGYSREEFSHMSVHSLQLPFVGDETSREFRVEPRAPFVLTGTWRHRGKNGRVADVELRATRVRFGGRPALLTLVLDAARERAVEALQRSEQHFDDAQAHARVGSWTWSVLKPGVAWSQELRRMYGVSADAQVSRLAFLSLVHVDDRVRVSRRLADATERREYRYEMEYRVVRPDGVVRVMHARHATEYDLLGVPIHRTGTVRDITDT